MENPPEKKKFSDAIQMPSSADQLGQKEAT
jgi:hypothetical protein